jgi:hypothetical protein
MCDGVKDPVDYQLEIELAHQTFLLGALQQMVKDSAHIAELEALIPTKDEALCLVYTLERLLKLPMTKIDEFINDARTKNYELITKGLAKFQKIAGGEK